MVFPYRSKINVRVSEGSDDCYELKKRASPKFNVFSKVGDCEARTTPVAKKKKNKKKEKW